jgi:predicted RNase H-like HicB family nuclease
LAEYRTSDTCIESKISSPVFLTRLKTHYLADTIEAVICNSQPVGWVDARKPNFHIHIKIRDKFSKILNLMKIKAIIHPAEEGGYWAEVPALPGCITEGDSMDEVIDNLQDAIQGWLEVANESKQPESRSEVIEIAV